MRSSINSYLDAYLKRGTETAFSHRRGLRLARWSYARVAKTGYRFARELEARGVGRGERVLFWAANGPEWVAAFFGCALRGVIVVPLDVESAPDFVARVQEQTQGRLLLVSSETKKGAANVVNSIATASGLASLSPASDAPTLSAACVPPTLSTEELDEELSRHSSEPYGHEGIGGGDIVEIIYTSGTTAEPRGVVLTHANLLANLAPLEAEMKKYMRWERLVHPLRFLSLVPLSHVFGQFMGIFVPQLLGGEVFFQDSLNPSEIVENVRRRRVSVVVTVPRLLDTLREHVERQEASRTGRAESFRSAFARAAGAHALKRWWLFRRVHRRFGWKFWAFVSGGASLSEETETFWGRLGFAVLQGYGMTETASLITVNHPFKSARGAVGKTLPGQELRLDEHGEILVRGANVSPGYWKGGVEPFVGEAGWLRTGDLGEMDAAGNIFFKGRKKDVIVTAAGLNIHPEDIEAALSRQPEVKLCAVVGIEGTRGPEPLAVLIMRDAGADPADAIERANLMLARHQQVRRWHIWPESDFPRTATQKVRKRDIIALIIALISDEERTKDTSGRKTEKDEGGSIRDEEVSASVSSFIPHPSSLIPSLVPSLAASAGGDASATLGASAKLATDLNLDSLGRVELLSAIEDRYQIEIDEASFTAATTLGEVEEIVRGGGAESGSAARYPYPEWAQRFPTAWFRVAFYYAVVLPITSLLCWVRVRGDERLRSLRGPALFVSNHITYFDHALILSALPGRFRRSLSIAQEGERLRWWRHAPEGTPPLRRWRWLAQYFLVVSIFNTFSLPQKSGFRRSFAYAGASVDRGYSVLVFPEGRRTDDGNLRPFMGGTGLLASKLGVPVVPVRIEGLSELKLSGRRGFSRPGSVTIKFGEPVTYAPGTEPAEITADLELRIARL
ncbi:MAG: AMP-binding protein [Acidobacteria bacterium]|nr:AMP-binding protein [Acidobacteriota bacterium]